MTDQTARYLAVLEEQRRMVRLGDIEPRERAGARTGQRYEFQYQRTAKATLTLLDASSICGAR